METPKATQLSELIHRKASDLKELCEGIDEETASRAPSGRWSPKEIVSHLCGPEGIGHLPSIYAMLEKDTPRLDIEVENPFLTEDRSRRTFAELLGEFDREYGRMAEFVAGLSEEQLSRKAHIPILKETPIGEYPTLAEWVQVLAEYHVGSHTDHMRAILEALGVESGIPRKQVSHEEDHAVSP
ncbi:MAG: DinB family protein [Thermodesulfobacteriota bacterium]